MDIPHAEQLESLLDEIAGALSGLPGDQRAALEASLEQVRRLCLDQPGLPDGHAFDGFYENGLRLGKVLSGARAGVFVRDLVNCTSIWSPEARALLGVGLNEPSSTAKFVSLVHPQDRPRVEASTQAAMEKGGPFYMEFRIIRPDGTVVWLSSVGYVEQDAQGRPLYIAGINQDITGRKQAEERLQHSEEKLRRSEEQLRTAFEKAAIAFAITEPDGRFVDANPAYCALTGYTMEELKSSNFSQFIHPEDRPHNMHLIQQMLDGENPGFVIENRYVRKDGQAVWVRKSISLSRTAEGEPQWIIALVEDITERKRVEMELQASQEQLIHSQEELLENQLELQASEAELRLSEVELRASKAALEQHAAELEAIFNTQQDAIVVTNPQGVPMRLNKAAQAVLGFNPLGRTPEEITQRLGFQDGARSSITLRAVRGETVQNIEQQIAGRTYLTSAAPMRDEQARVIGAVTVLKDITGRKQAELALRANEMELRAGEAELRKGADALRLKSQELQTLMDSAPAVIWISRDPECREMVGNRYSYDFLNIRQGENVSKTAPEEDIAAQAYHVEKDGRVVPPEELPLQVAAATGRPALDYDFDLVYEDGTVYNMLGNVNPLSDADGKPYGAIGVFIDITSLRRLESERIESRAEIEVQRRLMDQREQERQGIARDIHDGPIQTLSSVVFHLHLLKETFTDPAIQVELSQVGQDIKRTVRELREVINELRPPALMHFGFSRVLQMHTEDFRERHPEIEIEMDVMDDGRLLSDQARLALFRIYQAAIHNILRHAEATRIWVTYKIEGDGFFLSVRDNGHGFDLSGDFSQLTREGHFGLVGMKERAEAIGGAFAITSLPGEGTTIVVRGPLLGGNLKGT